MSKPSWCTDHGCFCLSHTIYVGCAGLILNPADNHLYRFCTCDPDTDFEQYRKDLTLSEIFDIKSMYGILVRNSSKGQKPKPRIS